MALVKALVSSAARGRINCATAGRRAAAGIRHPFLTLVLLLALPQVKGETWTVWACAGSSNSTESAPASEVGCCKWTGESAGTFTTDVRR
jgi:hypothetical protein